MKACLNLEFLLAIKSGDLLTYAAIVLAYIAFVWSINRDLKSWKSLFVSLKADLDYAHEWLANEYTEETYNSDKSSYSPKKIIMPLVFESLPEIIRRGVAEFSWISTDFIKNLSLFNERILAFNSILDNIQQVVSADPIVTEKLNDHLNKLGLEDDNFGFDEFKKQVREQKIEIDILYLAENIRRLNQVIHVQLINNKSRNDRLHYLYSQITKELENILNIFDNEKPWFVRYANTIFLLSIPVFVLLEWIFLVANHTS